MTGCLAAAVLAAAPVQPQQPEVADCRDSVVSINGGVVERQSLIDAVVAACGLRLVQFDDIEGQLELLSTTMPLSEMIDVALSDYSYQLHLIESVNRQRGSLWIFSEGSTIPPESELMFEAVLLHGAFSERREAVRQLRRIANIEAVQLLSVALGDTDSRIRAAAEEALASIGDNEALAALASAAAYGDTEARIDAIGALSMSDGSSTLSYLAEAMNDDDPRVRAATVLALGDTNGELTRQLLVQALDDPDEAVRETALEVIDELDGEALIRALMPVN